MLFRKRSEPAPVRYWSLISESMCARYDAVMMPGSGLVIRLGPRTNLNLLRRLRRKRGVSREVERQEQPAVALKSVGYEGLGQLAGIMRQQLRLGALHARRLLQRLDHVLNQPELDSSRVRSIRRDEQVANNALLPS